DSFISFASSYNKLRLKLAWLSLVFSWTLSPTYAAVGDSVTLKCYFIPAAEDLGELDIEWSIKPSDAHGEETRIIWNAGNHTYDGYDPLRGRVQFASPNPESGNASIRITDLRATDQNTYQCKVRKLPEISMTNMDLNVMERPTVPECNLEGVVDLGHNVVLRCRITQGSPPMWYSWSKDSSDKMLPNGTLNELLRRSFKTLIMYKSRGLILIMMLAVALR
uniref:Ig-like domain-containing protein n=1 Tax=Mastacembelus armatus TaxID=205130 RepID=A0A3Q3RZ32_9TELE